MATRFFTWRPSALAAACSPFALAGAAQAHLLGQSAVQVRVRTAPTNGLLPAAGATVKINNYIGTIAAAAAEGATTSREPISAVPTPALRVQKVQGDMVKGGDARGIPPRGTPV
jgi:hypothetical protein